MKKTLLILLSLMLVISGIAGCGGGGGGDVEEGNKTVYIGIFEPQSGDNGPGGKQEMLGMLYANYLTPTVVIDGETYNVELIAVDNQSSNDKAPSAAQELISRGVSVVLGSYGSGVSIAASPTFADAGVPVIGVTCTNPAVTLGNDHYFRLVFLDPFQGTVLASHARNTLGARTAYVLTTQGDDYSQGLSNFFIEAFGRANVIQEFYPPGTSDFSPYIATARARGADVFMSPTIVGDAQLIIDQIIMQGLTIPILAGDTWDNNVIVEATRGRNIRLYVSTFYAEGANPEFDAGLKAFINANPLARVNNGGTDRIAASTVVGFDAYNVALEAFRRAGTTNSARVLEALRGVQMQGITGFIEFDAIGDRKMDFAFIKRLNTQVGGWDSVGQVFAR